MRAMKMKKAISISELFPVVMMALALLFTATAQAAAPGIKGQSFALTAQAAYLNQPDGEQVYSWGYGCTANTGLTFAPTAIGASAGASCPTMQVPGPTLIVTEGQPVTITLINQLPTSAGNTSLLFPGFNVTATGGVTGLLTQEATPGGTTTVTYKFTPSSPGTRAYYSGTQGDLQIEMGLYGAIIVLPSAVPTNCNSTNTNLFGKASFVPETDFRLANAAYDHPETCYDREYLFQFSEMDGIIHRTALAQVQDAKRVAACTTSATAPGCSLEVPTEPYKPSYFLINGRSMPDDMDANYAVEYPHQPYNGNPHMHPGEQVLIRVIGQGRWEHPFHEHGNHVRILARDGNLLRGVTDSATTPDLSGLLMFTTDTFPGQSFDGIFYWTGRGLNWDAYGHNAASSDAKAKLTCTPDANGYNTSVAAQSQINYYEWCQDHNKPLQAAPFGDVAAGGPATLPDPNIFTNGAWYGGSPYLGPDATLRAVAPACSGIASANCSSQQPSNTQANPPNERGYAFMWHSHNEREITTNNVFPGGMLMMMLVDSREFVINEAN
jgi:FtsP/CotA-like multicopper oxidase with cupredoxin domain